MKNTLNFRVYRAFLLLLSIGFSTAVSAQMKTVVCPPTNEPVMVPKKPQKFYESYVKQRTNSLKGTINILDKIKLLDIDASTKSEVVELREKLNQYNISSENVIKASVLGFCMAPCDTAIRGRHYRLLEAINKQNLEIEKARLEITKIHKAGNAAGVDDEKIKSVIGKFNANDNAKAFTKP